MNEKIVLVGGGAGGVGEGIVRQMMLQGATVVVPSRAGYRLARLKDYVSDVERGVLDTYETDISNPEQAAALRDEVVDKYGRINLLVASLGGWWQGLPLVRVPMERWHHIMQDNLTSHVVFARTFMPVLLERGEGMYAQINGFSGETPYPGAAPVSMAAAALLMMGQIMALEHEGAGVKIYELVLGPILTRSRGMGRAEWYNPMEIGEYILELYHGTAPRSDQVVHHLLEKALIV